MRIMRSRVSGILIFCTGALLFAAAAHLTAVLLLPHVALSGAVSRLSAGTQINAVEVFQPVRTATDALPLPFADPAMITAVCRFDISDGPVRMRIPTGEAFLSVAILSPSGQVVLALTDKAATRRLLDIVLLSATQLRQLEAKDPDDEPVRELRVRIAAPQGVAVIRSLAVRDAERDGISALLGRSSCMAE
jgi:uncharacterized membrane protein